MTRLLANRLSKTTATFWLCALWSIIQLGMCVVEFLKIDAFKVPPSMPFIYAILVFLYFVNKEFDRWLNRSWRKRQDEYFIVIWWCVLLAMTVIEFATQGKLTVPTRMIETCLAITVPFLLTEVSKHIHAKKHRLQIMHHQPKHHRRIV